MPIILATRAEAMRNPKAHTFKPKIGYLKPGEPTRLGPARKDACAPPVGTPNNSWHTLQPPGGAPLIAFQWKLQANCWYRLDTKSNRLGYSPQYLSSYGWSYSGKADGQHG